MEKERVGFTTISHLIQSQTFTHRESDDRFVIIIFGTFDEENLKVLATDEILYPDQITDFVMSL